MNRARRFVVGDKVLGKNNRLIGLIVEVLDLAGGRYYAVDFTGDGADFAEICAEETLEPTDVLDLSIFGRVLAIALVFFGSYKWVNEPLPAFPGTLISTNYLDAKEVQ